jgi:hypothetical protein
MTCSGRYAQARDYEELLCTGIDLENAGEVATVNAYLDLAASDIHVALAAVGACDCTLEGWASEYLKKLNVIDAAVIQNCPCGNRIPDERKATLSEWLERQYELIRSGKTPLCQGDSGSDFPAFGTAEYSFTSWNAAQIAYNRRR